MKQQRILLEVGLPYSDHTRNFIWGVRDYAQHHCPEWRFISDPFDFYQSFQPNFISPENVDGAFISILRRNKTLDVLQKKGIPTINLTYPDEDLGIPCVAFDDRAIGFLAGQHLDMAVISKTLYIGPESRRGTLRLEGFCKALKEAGKAEPHVLIEPHETRKGLALRRLKHIETAIKKLRVERPARLGVFTFSDSFGHAVTEACYKLNLLIPNDVAVVACGNEALICSLSRVPLSSIQTNSRMLGMKAAMNLHFLMNGKKINDTTLIEPLNVVERYSSSRIAVDDPVIATALGIIREKACSGLRVSEILDFLPISRRSFEIRFRSTLGCSPLEEIIRVKIEMAFAKLVNSNETNAKIAYDCGFSSATQFEQSFRKHMGHPPSYYRKEAIALRSEGNKSPKNSK